MSYLMNSYWTVTSVSLLWYLDEEGAAFDDEAFGVDSYYPDSGSPGTMELVRVAINPANEEVFAMVSKYCYWSAQDQTQYAFVMYSDAGTGTWAPYRVITTRPDTAQGAPTAYGWGDMNYWTYGDIDTVFVSFGITFIDGVPLCFVAGNSGRNSRGSLASGWSNNAWMRTWLNPMTHPASSGARMDLLDYDDALKDYAVGRGAKLSIDPATGQTYLFYLGNDGYALSWLDPDMNYDVTPGYNQYQPRLFTCWATAPHTEAAGSTPFTVNSSAVGNQYATWELFDRGSSGIDLCTDNRGYAHSVASVYISGATDISIIYIRPTAITTWASPVVIASSSTDLTAPRICFDPVNAALVIVWADSADYSVKSARSVDYGVTWSSPATLMTHSIGGYFNMTDCSAAIAATTRTGKIMLVAGGMDTGDGNGVGLRGRLSNDGGATWESPEFIAASDNSNLYGTELSFGDISLAGGAYSFAMALTDYLSGNIVKVYRWVDSVPADPTLPDAAFGDWAKLAVADGDHPTAGGRSGASFWGSTMLKSGTRLLVAEYNSFAIPAALTQQSHILHYSDDDGATWTHIDIWPYAAGATVGHDPMGAIDYVYQFFAKHSSTIYFVTNTMNDVSVSTDYIAVQKSTDNGATWAARVMDTSVHQRVVATAASANGIYVVGMDFVNWWDSAADGEYSLMRSTDEGATWSTITATGVKVMENPAKQSVVIDGSGNLHALIHGDAVSGGNRVVKYFRPTGAGTWSSTLLWNSPAADAVNAQLLISGSALYAFWMRDTWDTAISLMRCVSTDSGVTWSTPAAVMSFFMDYDLAREFHPFRICMTDNGYIHMVLWQGKFIDKRYDDANYTIAYFISTDGGVVWSTQEKVVSDPGGNFDVTDQWPDNVNYNQYELKPEGNALRLLAYGPLDTVSVGKHA